MPRPPWAAAEYTPNPKMQRARWEPRADREVTEVFPLQLAVGKRTRVPAERLSPGHISPAALLRRSPVGSCENRLLGRSISESRAVEAGALMDFTFSSGRSSVSKTERSTALSASENVPGSRCSCASSALWERLFLEND